MNEKHFDHRGHREHRGESNGTLAFAARMGGGKKKTSSSKFAQSSFFPHQTRPAEIIRVLKRNLICYAQRSLGAVQKLRPRLSLKPEMTPVSSPILRLCALCVLCGQSLLPLA
jgi:hypothetical protein